MPSVLKPDPEALRRGYLPERVRILFVGESPPASGRFFYRADSGLYRAVREVFQAADPAISDGNFLQTFQKCGCYLIDLCADPVDQLEPQTRRAACFVGEESLSRSVKQLNPEMIVSLVRSIQSHVARAAANADWDGPMLDLPYPGRWIRHRQVFSAQLRPYVLAVLRNREFKRDDDCLTCDRETVPNLEAKRIVAPRRVG